MKRNRKTNGKSMLLTFAVIVALIGGIFYIVDTVRPGAIQSAFGGDTLSMGSGSGSSQSLNAVANCGDTRTTTLTLNLYNSLNDTGRETFDAGFIIYDAAGGLFAIGTDSTEGTVSNLVCGAEYVLRFTGDDSTDDGAMISAVRSGLNARVIEGGRAVQFAATEPSMRLELNGKQVGGIQARVFDNIQAAFATDASGDGSTADYEGDGTTFRSTSSNTTAIAVGDGGRLDQTWFLQSTGADVDGADFGLLIAIDAAPTVWDRPVLRWNGAELSDIKGTLDAKSATALSGYEYVFFIPAPASGALLDQRSDEEMDFRISALSGVNPGSGDDVEVDFVVVTAARETTGNSVRYAGYSDAASPTALFAVQDFTVDVS